MADIIEEITGFLKPEPLHGYRFRVYVLLLGFIPLEMRCKSVSGLNVSIARNKLEGAGHVNGETKLPSALTYGDLELESSIVANPILSTLIRYRIANRINSSFTMLVTLLDRNEWPKKNWIIYEAFPTSWSASSFDADSGSVVTESIKFSYDSFSSIGL